MTSMIDYAMSPANKLAVAYEHADARFYRARSNFERAKAALIAIPGGGKLAENRELSERRLRAGKFPALYTYWQAFDEMNAADYARKAARLELYVYLLVEQAAVQPRRAADYERYQENLESLCAAIQRGLVKIDGPGLDMPGTRMITITEAGRAWLASLN
jgi:hypothetical protein